MEDKKKNGSRRPRLFLLRYYNNERVFSFDAYAAKLLKAFRTLENTPNRRTPSNQVKILIDNIRITSPEFAVIKGHVRITHRSDLHGAISYISREVSELFPDVTVPSRNQGRHRFISETTSSSRPRSFHGLTQENGVYHFYGVDVTDVQRRFSSQEMQTLGPGGQAYVYQERERLRGTNNSGRGFGGRGRGGRGGGGRYYGSGGGGRGGGNRDNRGISEIQTGGGGGDSVITDITNDQTRATGTQGQGQTTSDDRGSTNGRRFGAGAYGQQGNQGENRSQGGQQGGRGVSTVTCGPQRQIGKIEKGWLLDRDESQTTGRNETDTMADTCCAGRNWTLVETTGMECAVNDLTGNQVHGRHIPVATCATVIREAKTGVELVLIGHQMLWFGEHLDKSLLNQNQIRFAGHTVKDDPTRVKEDGFGIWADGIHIPFELQGTTVYFESRAPTFKEIEELPSVTLTRQELWDPRNVDLTQHDASPYIEAYDASAAGIGQVSRILTPAGISQELAALPSIKQVDTTRHSQVTPETISRKWKVGLETARATLRVTTQQGIRTAVSPITRRYRVDNLALHRNRLDTRLFTDTLFSKTLCLSGNKCAQVFTDGQYTAVYPMASKSQAGHALAQFIDEVGVPACLTADLAGEQTGASTLFSKLVRHHRIDIKWSEKGTGKQNHRAEREIGLLKERWRRRMADLNVPKRLWDYGLVYEAGILNRVARGQDGRTGIERLAGDTPDISEWLDFSFFDLVWFHDNSKGDTTDEQPSLGYWLGVAHRIGSDLCYWVLTKSGKVIARTTVQHVTQADMDDPKISERIRQFKLIVAERLDNRNFTDQETKGPGYLEDVEELEEERRDTRGESSQLTRNMGRWCKKH